jgi:hypothetical protein
MPVSNAVLFVNFQFIYHVLSSLDCVASSGRTISKHTFGKSVGGRVPGQSEAVSRHLLKGLSEPMKAPVKESVFWPRLETGAS